MVINAAVEMEIVGEAEGGDTALTLIERLRPDVAVLDINMPAPDGIELARLLKSRQIPTKIVILTMHKDEVTFNAALEAGITGFIVKDSAASEIVSCIMAVASGQTYFSPTLSALLLRTRRRMDIPADQNQSLDSLSPAERRILKLIAASKTNKEIAQELFISIRTVENHRSNICSKLGLTGAQPLLRFALNHKSDI